MLTPRSAQAETGACWPAVAGWPLRGAMAFVALCLAGMSSMATDWPAYRHDVRRSGVTTDTLSVPLSPEWTYATRRGPAPAWTESPARHDYLHGFYDMKPRQAFDRCFGLAVVGDRVYFGSSRSGAVSCLLATEEGRVDWTFFTDSPVRFAPQVVGERLYVGSDDGSMYCLSAREGTLIWKERIGPTSAMLWGNENMISAWPVRTSVLVAGDHVYWAAGLFPEEGIFLCQRLAADGTGGWTQTLTRPPQGYLLATADRLFVPTGKTSPLIHSRQTGESLGQLKQGGRDGGCWALIEPTSDTIWTGPTTDNALQGIGSATGTRVAAIKDATSLVVDDDGAFYTTGPRLVRLDRTKGRIVWSRQADAPDALIKAGTLLFAGGADRVVAFSMDGDQVWETPVDGRALDLAVAGGRLYVSTDKGSIHCFKATLPRLIGTAQVVRVGAKTAQVVGHLGSPGGAPTSMTLYWGQSDGDMQPDAWENRVPLGARTAGEVAYEVGPLRPNTTYRLRFAATNSYGTSWGAASTVFTSSVVTVVANDADAAENGLDPGQFTFSRSGDDVRAPLTVGYRIEGTAVGGEDYAALEGQVVIPAGSRSAVVTVTPHDDLLLDEPEKTVVAVIAPGPYGVGTASRAVVTLSDRDSMAGWQHRARLVVKGYTQGGTLRGFPAVVYIDGRIPGFRVDDLAEGGADLRFTDGSGSVALPYEVAEWLPDGGARVWVRVPELTAATSIQVWWGNATCTASPAYVSDGSAWGPDHVGVWHMDGESSEVHDASPARNHGQAVGVQRGLPGVVGRSIGFSGEKGRVGLTSILPIGGTANSLSLWAKVPKPGNGGLGATERVGIILGNFGDTPNSNWELHGTGEMRWYWNRGQPDCRGNRDLRDGEWHHLAWVRDSAADALRVYVDGELGKEYASAGADIAFTTKHTIGADNRVQGTPWFHGSMDEMWLARAARSTDWIRACYENQSSPGTFWSYEPMPAPTRP